MRVKTFKEIFGFSDTLILMVGIPFIALLVNTLLFGHLLQDNAPRQFSICICIALVYTCLYWFTFRFIFRLMATQYEGVSLNKKRQFMTGLIVLITYFIIQLMMEVVMNHTIKKYSTISEPNPILKVITSLVFTILVLAIYEGLYLSTQIHKSEHEKMLLLRSQVHSQLAGLKEQINPHFLFNALNTLSSLVHEDANKADAFIGKLAKVYRYMLEKNKEHVVTIEEELKYVQAYIYLLKERFGDNLMYIEKVDYNLHQHFILSLSIQLLLENGVKHNIISKEKPLTLEIVTSDNSDYLVIRNNLQKITFPHEKLGIGLENLIKRYAFFTDKNVIIEESGDHFTVKIPILKTSEIRHIADNV